MFKGMGNFASLMKQARELGGRMEEVNQQLQEQRVVGSAGADLVRVEANGLGEVLQVHIDPSLLESGDREMLEDLLPAAINQANQKAKQLHAESMQSLMDVPGLEEAIGQFMGQPPGPDGGE